MADGSRLIVVSNRIPTDETPSGGLIVALHQALTAQGGIWIGSSGAPKDAPRDGVYEIADGAYQRLAFDLSHEEHRDYYLGYANSVLWPLFHRRADLIDLQPGYAEGYLAVNARVADALAEIARPGDRIWIQDYHFLPLAALLRARLVTAALGFFLHIPFPTASDVPALPQADDLLDWVAAYDLFGVQTEADVQRVDALVTRVEDDERRLEVRAFPIGIDAGEFRREAERSTAGDRIKLGAGQKICVGIDRLDYSKGIVHRFEGFAAYLEHRSDTDPRAILVQVAPPSREDVEAYQDIRAQLEMMAGRVNGAHADLDWTPIRYFHKMMPREELAGVLRRADVALVTPLADGMNLVAKEFIAAQDPADPGVLILSHFAGAAEQLSEALLVNPYDAGEIGAAVAEAIAMPLAERQRRHQILFDVIERQDIHWWTEACLGALAEVS